MSEWTRPEWLGHAIGVERHLLSFDTGSPLLVAETFERTEEPARPDEWRITSHVLAEPVVVERTGTVEVLRLPNEDSYQGPLQADTLAQLTGGTP